MQQVIQPRVIPFRKDNYVTSEVTKESLIKRFIVWCNMQEGFRLFWMGLALLGGIGTIVPLTLLAVVFFADNNFALWVIVCAINVPVLILNLAAQPTKVTLPVLFFAWAINALIIVYSIAVFIIK
jgi:hypothetical protein